MTGESKRCVCVCVRVCACVCACVRACMHVCGGKFGEKKRREGVNTRSETILFYRGALDKERR